MSRLALATYAALPTLNDDDRLLLTPLQENELHAEPAVWDDETVDWRRYDAVVVRSVWDYHHRYDEFVAWLGRVEQCGVRLVNPGVVLRWNADKRYLRDLAQDGVRTVATQWVDAAAAAGLDAILENAGWRDAVVKPAISASGHETWRTSRNSSRADQERFTTLVASSPAVLVQPFVKEVVTQGEWSLVVIAGEYSHAALKRPAADDFRVQWEHGGRADRAEPSRQLVADAVTVVDVAARRCGLRPRDVPYARVDGVERDGRLLLMELECLEPYLFLGHSPEAPRRLARAVLETVNR